VTKWTFTQIRSQAPSCPASSTAELMESPVPSKQHTLFTGRLVTAIVLLGCGTFVSSAILALVALSPSNGTAGGLIAGSYIYSAMALNNNSDRDADLEQILHWVVSDMGGKWTYRELEQARSGVRRMDTVLAYHPTHARPEDIEYNTQLNAALPLRFDMSKSQSWWFASSPPDDVSSCICNGFMQIMYNEADPIARVAVVVHEYYHVLQTHYCGDDDIDFVMWLHEGCATVFQNLYVDYWLSGNEYHRDNPMFRAAEHGHVFTMMNDVKAQNFSYDSRLDSHEGASTNYIASTTAVLYLIHRMGGGDAWQYVLSRYLTTSDCDLTTNGGRDAGFKKAFGRWETVDDFYDELNKYLNTTNSAEISKLAPSTSDVEMLMNHTLFCSDICVTSRDGVCDASCQHGSDCSDCGPLQKPVEWNITLREPYHRSSTESP